GSATIELLRTDSVSRFLARACLRLCHCFGPDAGEDAGAPNVVPVTKIVSRFGEIPTMRRDLRVSVGGESSNSPPAVNSSLPSPCVLCVPSGGFFFAFPLRPLRPLR